MPVPAATPTEFYLGLLRRGVGEYDAGRWDSAARNLRIAAFGLLDAIEHYQTAQIYLTLADDQLGDAAGARAAAHRVVTAEKLQPAYGALALPDPVRAAFNVAARKLLPAAELAILQRSPSTSSPRPPATATATVPAPQPPVSTPSTTAPSTTVPSTNGQSTAGQSSNVPSSNVPSAAVQPATVPPATTEPRPTTTVPPATAATTTPPRHTTNNPPATTTPRTTTNTPPPATTEPRPTATNPPAATTPRNTTNNPPAVTPPRTTTTNNPPASTQPRNTPAPVTTTPPATTRTPAATPPPASKPPATTTTVAPTTVAPAFAAAERALNEANLGEARRIYRELLNAQLSHEQFLRVAEGLYRARDFAGAILAFNRAGALQRGEEPYRYYLAVALYETSQHARAKIELAAVLPYIEITPDVARYRLKIEGAID